MTLQEKIDAIVVKHNEALAMFPDIKEINWLIDAIPYREFSGFRNAFNDVRKNNSRPETTENLVNDGQDKMFMQLHSWDLDCEKCLITIFTVPLKIKTTHEVEELETVINPSL